MTDGLYRPKWDTRSAEVWERRPGSRWMPVHSGGLDSMKKWVKDREKRGLSVRFSSGTVELVVLPAGDHPDDNTVPTAVVEVGSCPGSG